MPRLFTAIEIPADVAQMLTFLRGGLPGARWIDQENYHITLRFIGDVDLRVAHDVASMLDRVSRPAFDLRLDGVVVVRRAQAARGIRQCCALAGADGSAGRARAADAARGPSAGRSQIHPACHARALARFVEPAGCGLSERARLVSVCAVPGRALRAVFVARFGRRRAVCGGSGLSVGDRGGASRDLSITRTARSDAARFAANRSYRQNRRG